MSAPASPKSAHYRVSEAARLLGVSDDTIRRWIGSRLTAAKDAAGRLVVDGAELAALARDLAPPPELADPARQRIAESARNRFAGIVTDVVRDGVMAKVEMQAGPFRVVSLMTREAADELCLAPGVTAVASVKSTQVVVERHLS